MTFPEGRLYTIQFTGDELIWLLDQDFLWKDYAQDSVADTAQLKIHEANSNRQQDKAIAHLYKSTQERHDWLEEKLCEKIRELRECQKQESTSSGPSITTVGEKNLI